MKSFEYGDQEIGKKEIVVSTASMVVGIGILTLPRLVASTTEGFDGWISITIGGVFSIFFAWIVAKLASSFPKQTFFDYVALIATKPVAVILTLFISVGFIAIVSLEVRTLGNISKQYMFDRTPVEVLCLVFLITVVYAVSGSRAALIRLNLLFFPIVVSIICFVLLFNITFFETGNLKPIFVTKWSGLFKGAKESIFSFVGYAILLFYIALMNRPKEAPTAAVIGMTIPLILYLFIYLFILGVLSQKTAMGMIYPTIEIAREVEVPGGFFERFDSVFFTIWIMTIFNTTAMAFDVSIIALSSIFRNVKKQMWIFSLSPLIFIIAMGPQNQIQLDTLGTWIAYLSIIYSTVIPPLLLLIVKMRGVKGNG
jgi:spore germination protein